VTGGPERLEMGVFHADLPLLYVFENQEDGRVVSYQQKQSLQPRLDTKRSDFARCASG
jgi:hypothetical protein